MIFYKIATNFCINFYRNQIKFFPKFFLNYVLFELIRPTAFFQLIFSKSSAILAFTDIHYSRSVLPKNINNIYIK